MKIGDLSYFSILIVLSIAFALILSFLKKKDKEYQYKFLLIWCFINFSLHFLKQLVYFDVTKLTKSTAENICAVSTLVFPFIMLIKKNDSPLKDFMFLIGVIGGLAGMLYPTEVRNRSVFRFETFRFYFCHFSLFAIPMLLAILNIRRPRFKAIMYMPLLFLVYQLIICSNTALLCFTGWVTKGGYTQLELFLSTRYYNNSFTFGPTADMGAVGRFIGSLCPNFMKIDIFNINNGLETYWPVIWLLLPSYVLFVPLYLTFGAPFFIIDELKKKENSYALKSSGI